MHRVIWITCSVLEKKKGEASNRIGSTLDTLSLDLDTIDEEETKFPCKVHSQAVRVLIALLRCFCCLRGIVVVALVVVVVFLCTSFLYLGLELF